MYSYLLLAGLVSCVSAAISADQAIGTLDNSKVARTVQEVAIPIPDGKYYLQNVQNGMVMAYDNLNGRQWYPTSDESKKTPVNFIGNTLNGGPISRLDVGTEDGGRPFCPSAQWWYRSDGLAELPGDFLAALYGCSHGEGASAPTVRDAKQQYYIVPADADMDISAHVDEANGDELEIDSGIARTIRNAVGGSNDESQQTKAAPEKASPTSKTNSKPTTKAAKQVVQEDIEEAPTSTKSKSKPKTTSSELAEEKLVATPAAKMTKCLRERSMNELSLLERQVQPFAKYLQMRKRHLVQRRRGAVEKRQEDIHHVYLVTADHLGDMQSRCLSGEVGTPLGSDVKGTRFRPCDLGTLQQWILTKA